MGYTFGNPPVPCICRNCGKAFIVPSSRFLTGHGVYCSNPCYHGHRRIVERRIPLAERFWAKIDKNGAIPAHCPHLGACWLWLASKKEHGYGIIKPGGRHHWQLAHRVSWELHFGPIPEGMQVLHHCDTPSCTRPDHLFLGDPPINAADKVAKGRQNRGERNGGVKLTDTQVYTIRQLLNEGRSSRSIAPEFAVAPRTINDIARRATWKHL